MKKLITSFTFLLLVASAYAQQDALVSKNVFNGLLLNPAYAGSHPYFSAALLYRSQWSGFEGAPNTQLIEFDGPLAKETMGVGLVISHDKIGVTEETDFYASYSYKIKIGEKNKLAFGIRAGASNYKAKLSTLTIWDSGDEAFNNDIRTYLIPKFGYGMYFYSEKYFAGIAIPTLIAYDNAYSFSVNLNKSSFLRRHYYLNGGYVFTLNTTGTLKMKPAIMLKYVPAAPVQMDLSSSLIYKDMFTFGLAFRTGDALVGMLEYRTAQRIRIGYAYDFTISKFRTYSGGSHEIVIGYDFGAGKDKNVSPRYF
jgi:type IX secretion system PorP/SprF family membrane protein